MEKQTLFISSFHPLISRNIFQTKALKMLLEKPWLEVVILCPDYKEGYFSGQFKDDRIRVVGVKKNPLSKIEQFWKEFGNAMLRTSTIRGNRKERFNRDHGVFGYFAFLVVQNTLAFIRPLARLYQLAGRYIHDASPYESLIEKYKPTAVFSTDIFHDEDVRLLAGAKKKRVISMGMVRSWDNCTNKGILSVVPDSIIAHNEIIAGELRTFHGITADKIKITGIPQFDYYKDYKPKDPQIFFRKTGFSPFNKVIMFAPTGSKFVDDDWYLLQVVIDAIRDKKIRGNPQVLVRFPPGDRMDIDRVKIDQKVKIYIDRPGISFDEEKLKDREMSAEDMIWLADSLYFSDILISVGSTLCIDISVFNKPIVMPSIRVPGVKMDRSMSKMYNKFHYRYLLRSGGCYYPRSLDEYVLSINEGLENPHNLESGRKNLLLEQAGVQDGRSSERLAEAVLSIMHS